MVKQVEPTVSRLRAPTASTRAKARALTTTAAPRGKASVVFEDKENGAANVDAAPVASKGVSTPLSAKERRISTRRLSRRTPGGKKTQPIVFEDGKGGAMDVFRSAVDALEDTVNVKELLAVRITAKKFDYKNRISQCESLIKRLRVAVRDLDEGRVSALDKAVDVQQYLSAEAGRHEMELDQVKKELDEAVLCRDELHADLDTARTKAADAEVELASARVEAKQAAEQVAAEGEQRAAAEQRVVELQAAVSKLEGQLADREREVKDRESELATMSTRVAEAKGELERAQAAAAEAAAAAQAQMDELTARAGELETAKAAAEEVIAATRANLDAARADEAKVREELVRTVAEKERVEASVDEWKERLERKEADFQTTLSSFTRMQEMQQGQITTLQDEKRELLSVKDELTEEKSKLLVDVAKSSEEATMLRNHMESVKSELGELRHERATFEARKETLVEQVHELEKSKNDIAEELSGIKAEFDSFKEHCGTSSVEQMADLCKLQREHAILAKRLEETEARAARQESELGELRGEHNDLVQQRLDAENERRRMHNALQELKGKVRVMCRVRPPMSDDTGDRDADGDLVPSVVLDTEETCEVNVPGKTAEYKFTLDRIFGPHNTQADIFSEVSYFVQSAMDGYKVCLFAYGQTGTGKTFTMQGIGNAASETRGVIPRSVQQILETSSKMGKTGWTYELKASFVEIYNETLRDLLGDSKPTGAEKHNISVH